MNHLDLFHAGYAVRRVQERLCSHQAMAEYKRIDRIMDRGRSVAIGFRRILTPSP
ncbi:MAG: hypothetical protein R6W77_01100 [Trueperaceae bacterium]